MRKVIFGACLLLCFMLFEGQVLSHPHGDDESPPSKEQLEKTRKKVETLRMWKLTKFLDLDEKTASRLFPLMNEYNKKRLETEQDMRADMIKLRRTVDTAGSDELKILVTRLDQHHRRLQEINDEEMKKLGEVLPMREFAKFVLFRHDFDREMRRTIERVREKRRTVPMERPDMPHPEERPEDLPE